MKVNPNPSNIQQCPLDGDPDGDLCDPLQDTKHFAPPCQRPATEMRRGTREQEQEREQGVSSEAKRSMSFLRFALRSFCHPRSQHHTQTCPTKQRTGRPQRPFPTPPRHTVQTRNSPLSPPRHPFRFLHQNTTLRSSFSLSLLPPSVCLSFGARWRC